MSITQSPHPKISVIVLAYNAARTLDLCLQALSNQEGTVSYDCLVVYRDSADKTQQILKKYPQVRVVVQPTNKKGISVARNLGLASARGEIIAFTDADCVVPSDWIKKIDQAFSKNKNLDGYGGPLTSKRIHTSWMSRYGGYVAEAYGTVGKLATNNCAIKKSAVEKVGLFDETLTTGEDVDYSWRLEDAGLTLSVDSTLQVDHLWRTTIKDFIHEQIAYGQGRGALIVRFPQRYPLIERLVLPITLIGIVCFFIALLICIYRPLLGVFLISSEIIGLFSFSILRRIPLSKKIIATKGIQFVFSCFIVYVLIDISNIIGIVIEWKKQWL